MIFVNSLHTDLTNPRHKYDYSSNQLCFSVAIGTWLERVNQIVHD